MKILIRDGISADLDLGTIRPGTYELVHCTGRGPNRNDKPEAAYLLDNLTVSKSRVDENIANGNAEIILDESKKWEGVMTNLPQVVTDDTMSIERLKSHVVVVQQVMRDVMHVDEHFGIIPGCKKPSLWKPGAEKLSLTFRLAPYYEITETDLSNGHKNFVIKCTLKHISTLNIHGEGVGSCSTMETKYRYRDEERKCPKCNRESIIKGKEEFGGGWVCFKKKHGCGAKFNDGDTAIESQKVGRIEYDNPADFYNTALKMAKKRAHIDATLTATAASDIFTQDIEDMVENGAVKAPESHPESPKTPPPAPKAESKPVPESKPIPTEAEVAEFIPSAIMMKEGETKGKAWVRYTILEGDVKYTTFNKSFAKLAKDANINGKPVKVWFKTGKYGNDIELLIDPLAEQNNPGDEDDRYPR